MLDVGWQELFVIAVITIIVVGPKEIPRVLRTVTMWIRKIKEMAREFQSSIDDIAREAELDEIKQQLAAVADLDIEKELEDTIDPSGEVSNAIHDMTEPVEQTKSLSEEATDTAAAADDPQTDDKPEPLMDPTKAAGL
ncbi:MAG: twin-arginine translocase subunit TatB [Alphaproteobacteria bacterium]|nr:twin-arginine translocase subunit TatB [Alphaproteobacteria bacterium]